MVTLRSWSFSDSMLLGGGDHSPQRRCESGGSAGDRSQACCQLLIVAGYFCPNGEAAKLLQRLPGGLFGRRVVEIGRRPAATLCAVLEWGRCAWTRGTGWTTQLGTIEFGQACAGRLGQALPGRRSRRSARPARRGSRGSAHTWAQNAAPYLGHRPRCRARAWSTVEIDADGQVGGTGEDLVVLADPGCGSRPGRITRPERFQRSGPVRPAPPPGGAASVMLRGSSRATAPCRSFRPHGGVWASPDRHTGPHTG